MITHLFIKVYVFVLTYVEDGEVNLEEFMKMMRRTSYGYDK